MAGSLVIVHLPQAIYHRLEQAAARLRKPVDTLLAETLEAALARLPGGIEVRCFERPHLGYAQYAVCRRAT